MKTKKIETEPISLSKYLAQAGVASRRKVVDIIKSKVVTVNGIIIADPGYKITTNDSIKVNNNEILNQQKIYILLNKPKNCIATVSDERDRYNVMDIIAQDIKERVYPIGRLDRNTTGLLLLTNDGQLAQRLSHPSFEVEKVYQVQLDKILNRMNMRAIIEGIHLEDGFIKVNELQYIPGEPKNNILVAIHSGKNRIIRRIFEYLGYEVKKLDRIAYAGLTKTGLKTGQWRYLSDSEISYLKNLKL